MGTTTENNHDPNICPKCGNSGYIMVDHDKNNVATLAREFTFKCNCGTMWNCYFYYGKKEWQKAK